jgi:sorting nexin-8
MLPEKEGMFMFQHRNYEVKSVRRSSTVVRRYSDFVWLLDCLQKRYPFRRLPLLPPKRVQGDSLLPLPSLECADLSISQRYSLGR